MNRRRTWQIGRSPLARSMARRELGDGDDPLSEVRVADQGDCEWFVPRLAEWPNARAHPRPAPLLGETRRVALERGLSGAARCWAAAFACIAESQNGCHKCSPELHNARNDTPRLKSSRVISRSANAMRRRPMARIAQPVLPPTPPWQRERGAAYYNGPALHLPQARARAARC